MLSSKNVLMALGAVVAVVGLLGVLGVDLGVTGPVWYSWVKVVVGVAAVYVGYTDKGKK